MLSRVLSVSIVIFWLTMTALLMRSEIWPGQSALRAVPVDRVTRLLWMHQRPSNLTIWSDGQRIGHFSLSPTIRKEDGARLLKYDGSLQFRLFGSERQRVFWNGGADFDQALNLEKLTLTLSTRQPSLPSAQVLLLPRENRAMYRLFDDNRILRSDDYALDESGLRKILRQLEIDERMVALARGSGQSAPQIAAQQSSLSMNQGRIDTYRLFIKQGGQTILSAHIDQLGQVLQVSSLLGFTMAPEVLIP